ncbi:GatB/YqeY domain-containing protein [Propioniciclava sp. MC1595]|uniref:GatB/YqeY domain-containing protein n=1 Tax=Propioniciclava sp. MC1595 TaxID=2760308 RepID=UPI0016626EEF|nr:GatB/YqeY domain-containing protein [Propioniciclava sp. MC1595]MBB1495875.1 GatB/YqeY domain-containing protein [Propioniciclava sp. MC1595]QTE24592.1 GatB/YqeY domain-containing protein [Propioniciclava sp. MC1595]
MSLEEKLHTDMVAALKARDSELVTTLRMAIGALKNEKVAGKSARELTEADEVAVLQREVRTRKDSAQAYTDGNRPELAAKELAEADVIARYLPAMLGDDELDALVAEELAAAEAAAGEKPTMRQMGAIMKAVNARVAGRADGSAVAAKVKAALA